MPEIISSKNDDDNNHALNAHEFLVRFLEKFHIAKRGGIHDFMEITMFNMINLAIKNIDDYLQAGHQEVNGNELMIITLESHQRVIDSIKRNLEKMDMVNLQ
jgi:hypothetical protein